MQGCCSGFLAAGSAAEEMGPVRKLVGTTFASFRSSQKHDMVLALTANWCHPCGHYRKALDEIGAAFAEDPELEVAIIDVDENEIVHLLGGVQLRRLPWRFSMPLVFVPRHSSGGAAETAVDDDEEPVEDFFADIWQLTG